MNPWDSQTRVVVTGIGLVTPIGIGNETFWENLINGVHGFSEVVSFDSGKYRVHRGAEIPDFRLDRYLPDLSEQHFGRATQLALAAGHLALRDAGLQAHPQASLPGGVTMGTTSGEPNEIERFNDELERGPEVNFGSQFPFRYPCHRMPARLASHFGLCRTAPMMIPTACAAGNYAIAQAFDNIMAGSADLMLAGGADAFSRITYTGFARLMAISPDLCRPFDKMRKGMIPGEGAGFLVLETLNRARERKARIYAEIAGYGLSCDAHHMTGGHPEGRGAVKAMSRALTASGLKPHQVDYISAHGTGTRANDLHETLAVKRVFGDHAEAVPMSSIKSMIGHTMGAASAIEAATCALVIQRGTLPATMHLEHPDPQCDLDYVAGKARKKQVAVAMNNAYAFGGTNASLILKKVAG